MTITERCRFTIARATRPSRASWCSRLARFTAVAFVTFSGVARADELSEAVDVTAERLFQQARRLMEQKDFAAACPKLDQAYALDHGQGTFLALAACHRGLGKQATAMREFREALEIAEKEGQPSRVDFARTNLSELERSVARIVVVAPRDASRWSVTIDGVVVPPDVWRRGAPVDPGGHELTATKGTGAPP